MVKPLNNLGIEMIKKLLKFILYPFIYPFKKFMDWLVSGLPKGK